MKYETVNERVVQTARQWLGTPYRHQASLQGVGCDCLGLIRGVWREVQGEEPEKAPNYASTWSSVGRQESLWHALSRHFCAVEESAPETGHVLLFRMRLGSPAKHVGILSQEERFIHAYQNSGVVESHYSPFWKRCTVAAFQFPTRTH